jgi:acetyl esterase/lipase
MDDMSRMIIEQVKRDSQMMEKLNSSVPVNGRREKIRLRGRTIDTVFYPAEKKNAPVIFAFHGGGFVFGGCALDDNLYCALREVLGANIVSVGYRKGEKNPFPRPVNDAYDTVKYYIENLSADHDFDRSKIATYGGSAGGNLAATTSILAYRRKEFRVGMQIVTYPFVDSASAPESKGFPPEELAMMCYFNQAHARPEQWTDPLVSPVLAGDEDFDRAMHAVVVVAEKDALRHEAEIYANRLGNLGIDVVQYLAKGQGHGYFEFAFHDSLEGYCPPEIQAAAADGSLVRERDATLGFIKKHWDRWIEG